MALPYKLFKSLTIDGTTFGLDPEWGKIIENNVNVPNMPAGASVSGASITLDPGIYLIAGEWAYANGTTSAQRQTWLSIDPASGTSVSMVAETGAGDMWTRMENMAIVKVATQTQYVVRSACTQTITTPCFTQIEAIKLCDLTT